ncbi:MAG: formylglycine-generating enzyme family protein [Armatimonadetes bacterium]|nr:formylglycine-generating enzyme family protein [Armatimonadota bacterium]
MSIPFLTVLLIALIAVPAVAFGDATPVRTAGGQLITAPSSPDQQPSWLAGLKQWRASAIIDGALYEDPRRAWTQRNFVQALVIVQERTLFDPKTGRYTVDRYLDDVTKRYGGVDSVIIWHTYPNIGIDDRNQHDHLRDMPGGLPGLRKMVAKFHKRGVRVFFPIMPWDSGTRVEDLTLAQATARDMAQIGADGIFGDTLNGIDRAFLTAADDADIPLVLEPELNLGSDEMPGWNTMTWGQFWDEPFAPGISAYKGLEPRHMVHVTSRWAKNRTGDLQRAFLNGTGYQSWENIWGLWNGITEKDAGNLRRIAAIGREFADLQTSPDWEPYAVTRQAGVFASRFPGEGRTLWTLVNRSDKAATGPSLRITHIEGVRYFDLWNGIEIKPDISQGEASLEFGVPAHGFGAVLAVHGSESRRAGTLQRFLRKMAALPTAPESGEWKVLPQRCTPIKPTKPAPSAPEGMILIPGGAFEFRVSGVEIEGSDEFGIDVQYPWELAPRRDHHQTLEMPPFFIDRTPITNAEFKRFLDSSRYKPRDEHNFLRHWSDGMFPDGWANKPVTWVSLEDARAYARWTGKRLPREWEWQYAAQGTDGRLYPWGNLPDANAIPPKDTGRTMRAPTDVSAYPSGASPFGVLDMVGNVWQWTDEYTDAHTRSAILRGGSYYRPQGSGWYFPQAHRLDQHGKYLLMSPGKDRSGAIGFRCVVDAKPAG